MINAVAAQGFPQIEELEEGAAPRIGEPDFMPEEIRGEPGEGQALPQVEGDPLRKETPWYNTSQTLLMGATAVCALLSIIPPLRLGASLALRSVALLSISLAKAPNGAEGTAVKTAKIAAVGLSIVGLAASLPLLMVISVAVDLGTQVVGLVRAIADKQGFLGALHAFLIIIDTLVLVGLILGSWELMVASAAVTVLMMLAFAVSLGMVEEKDAPVGKKILTGLFFLTLAGIGIAGAISSAKVVTGRGPRGHREVITIQEPLAAAELKTLPFGGVALAAVEKSTPADLDDADLD